MFDNCPDQRPHTRFAHTGTLIQDRRDGRVDLLAVTIESNWNRAAGIAADDQPDVLPVRVEFSVYCSDSIVYLDTCFFCRRSRLDKANHSLVVIELRNLR